MFKIKNQSPKTLFYCYGKDEYRIVEINTINAAGFYAADLSKIIDAIENMEN